MQYKERSKNKNPYSKSREEINEAVAKMIIDTLNNTKDIPLPRKVNYDELKVRYNSLEAIKDVIGKCSYQALDASYPIEEKFWPEWLKKEVDKYHKYKK